jgi:CheY-like chemotaxis protein
MQVFSFTMNMNKATPKLMLGCATGQHIPQAVLSDLMMPGGMSGFELIARVRSNPQTEGVPIIVITGKDMTPDDKLFISNEIANVIRKGDLMMSDLETRLRQTLEEIGVKPNEWQKY